MLRNVLTKITPSRRFDPTFKTLSRDLSFIGRWLWLFDLRAQRYALSPSLSACNFVFYYLYRRSPSRTPSRHFSIIRGTSLPQISSSEVGLVLPLYFFLLSLLLFSLCLTFPIVFVTRSAEGQTILPHVSGRAQEDYRQSA